MTVSSVKNLNGETFSAVQDASLTDIVSSNSANWNEISAYQTNSANYLQNTDLTITDGKVTEISGVPLSAGDELPSGVMNTSALEYNAVNEISGYNGSAIAQYGAEKQWLVHDDTLVHASNSAQYALGVAIDNVAKLMGVDETVLWENSEGGRGTLTLSDNCNSYDRLRVYWDVWNQGDYRRNISELDSSVTKGLLTATYFNTTNNAYFSMLYTVSLSGTSFSILGNRYNNWTNNTVTDGGTNSITIYKIVGICRKD